MKKVLIYSNCAGKILQYMFTTHEFTKNKFKVNWVINYENLHKNELVPLHKRLLNECDIFIYQALNKHYAETEYNIDNVKKCLKDGVTIKKINFYRFRGFWYDTTFIPYDRNHFTNIGFPFNPQPCYGLHKDFEHFKDTSNKNAIFCKLHTLDIKNRK